MVYQTIHNLQVGDHLPVAPEVPPAIARALAYLATAKPWVDPSVYPTKSSKSARQLNVEEDQESKKESASIAEEPKKVEESAKASDESESKPLVVEDAKPAVTESPVVEAAKEEPVTSADSEASTEASPATVTP